MRRFVPLLLAALFGAAVPVLATSESAPDEQEHNRRALTRYRSDPEHYNRLLRDLQAFQALPAEKQERMRQFDRDLHEQDTAMQNHLWDVLERYADWVSRLQKADQERIEAAPEGNERLAVVKELRQRDWMDRLPQKDRDALALLPEDQRAAKVAEFRKQERQRRQEWVDWAAALKTRPDAPRPPRPARLGAFPPEAQKFINDQLRPMLSDEEQKQLNDAEGKWPLLALTILDLCERRPYLPPGPGGPITKPDQLPDEARKALAPGRLKEAVRDEIHNKEGKWPDYALAVADVMKQERLERPPPLGASRPEEFRAEVQDAIGKLKDADRARLRDLEGRWPDYPQTLLELARQNHLPLPGMNQPPGPQAVWTAALTALPEVPQNVLMEFLRVELDPDGKAAVRAAGDDPAERHEALKQEYFKKHPEQLQHWRRLERRAK